MEKTEEPKKEEYYYNMEKKEEPKKEENYSNKKEIPSKKSYKISKVAPLKKQKYFHSKEEQKK